MITIGTVDKQPFQIQDSVIWVLFSDSIIIVVGVRYDLWFVPIILWRTCYIVVSVSGLVVVRIFEFTDADLEWDVTRFHAETNWKQGEVPIILTSMFFVCLCASNWAICSPEHPSPTKWRTARSRMRIPSAYRTGQPRFTRWLESTRCVASSARATVRCRLTTTVTFLRTHWLKSGARW